MSLAKKDRATVVGFKPLGHSDGEKNRHEDAVAHRQYTLLAPIPMAHPKLPSGRTMTTRMTLLVAPVDFADPNHRRALVMLLDAYAQDPMGGGEPLATDVKARLCDDLAVRPAVTSFVAWLEGQPVGLVNCMEGYSTFKARPLMNIHDIAVLPEHRGQGIGQALLAAAEAHARARGCCKLTLEVLTGNQTALQSYVRFGFAPYELKPAAGQASFMQKWVV